MKTILARGLSRKRIMTNDGKVIGTLKNIMVNVDSGQITDIILEPDPDFNTGGFEVDNERVFIPFEAVRDIRDYIVVDRHLMLR